MFDFKFDIQSFADGGEGNTESQTETSEINLKESDGNATDKGEQKSESKSAEIDIDLKIAEAIAKAQKSFEESLKKREAAAKKEAERLSKLSDEERQKAEIETSRKELEAKEKELQRKELMIEMTKVLAERKIPVTFMEYLIADDNESTLERIKTFEKEYKAAIEAAVNEKLKGKTPPSGAGNNNDSGNTPRVRNGFMKIIADNQVKRG